MGIFLDYKCNQFVGLSDTPQTIITVDTNNIWVTSIIITNRTSSPIRINLKRHREQTSPTTSFILNRYPVNPPISPYDTENLIFKTGVIQLEYSPSPELIDSLICFSDGPSQFFDCEVNYAKLNELPMI